jgi:hypothetical protein
MFSLPTGAEICLFSTVSKPGVRFAQCPIIRYWELFRLGVKRPGVQAVDAVLFCFQLKNARSSK